MATDRLYTGQRWEAGIGLYDYNARYYDPALGRFVQADSVVPSPHNSQSFNRYLYTLGNPLRYTDPSGHSCVDALDGYPAEAYDCMDSDANVLVFYLNGLGGSSEYPRFAGGGEYIYTLYALSLLTGSENTVHVPLFTEPYQRGISHLDMFGEAVGVEPDQTKSAVQFIEQYLEENPLETDQRLVLVGSSAGGTVAIEALKSLEESGIYVDQVILRGSPILELSLGNVGRVDYIAADPPRSDRYYSVDINPFDNVDVNQHQVYGMSGHVPETMRQQRQVAGLIVDLIIDNN
jgi:RHS repeat-associated protein